MALWRKNVMIAYCKNCGSYGIPLEEKVFDPSTNKTLFVCRDCFTAHQEVDVQMVKVVNGKEWGEKHPVRDHILNVPFDGGKK